MIFQKLFLILLLAIACFIVSAPALDADTTESSSSRAFNEKAYFQFQQGEYEDSYKLSSEALVLAEKENNRKEVARAYSNIASNLRYFGETERALELYSKSLKESKAIDDSDGINRALNNLANLYSDTGDLAELKKFRQQLLENSLKAGNIPDLIIAHIGLAQYQITAKNYDVAFSHLVKARKELLDSPEPFLEIYTLLTEGDLLVARGEIQQAIELNQQAYQLARANQYKGLQLSSKTNIVEYYLNQNKFKQAVEEGEALLQESHEMRMQTKTLQLHNILKNAYESMNDYKKALFHERKSNDMQQRYSGQKVKFLGEITKIDRQVLEQQEKLVELEKDQQIMSLKLQQQKQNQVIWFVFAILIFGISFFLYYRHTSRREILRQKKLNRQLEELDKVKDRVLTNTSHELRTPLNGIIGLSDIIIKDENNKFSEPTLNCLKLIRSSGEQLALVINDILELSKLKNSVVTIVKSKFDLQELIKDVVAVCQPNLSGKQVNLVNRNEREQILVHLDRGRLQQVLFNIIGNAIKFTKIGIVEILCSNADGELRIVVTDTGIGIPTENLERVFEGFEQVDASNSREQSGTGLGLAITKEIIDAMGGTIELKSKLGKGTQVIITLPR